MKQLTPAMQDDTRYLKFRIHSDEKINISDLVEGFWNQATEFLGTKTLSEASPWVIANRYDEEKQEGVVRVHKKFEEDLRAALTLIENFDGEEGFVEVTEVSGSLSGLS
jgi:RNase P/RNase MRP subunit POP5